MKLETLAKLSPVTSHDAKYSEPLTLLCYGDSNTYGSPAEQGDIFRWPSTVRWTGRLQQALGTNYAVIEEGLRGRTTDIDYADPSLAGRTGLPYFVPCLQSHDPLHTVIIMLGTNDLKCEFDRSPAQIANSFHAYVDAVRTHTTRPDGSQTKIILVSPPHIDNTKPLIRLLSDAPYDHTSVLKSRLLAGEIQHVAKQRNVDFVDAAHVATVGADGVHLAAESHAPLAEHLAKFISDPQ